MMPWTAALFPTLWRLFKKRDPFRDTLQYCLVWTAFIFLFFSFSKTQLVTYHCPMFPPTAYLLLVRLPLLYRTKILTAPAPDLISPGAGRPSL